MFMTHLHVLQDLLEHVEQPVEEDLSRLPPPPMPNAEKIFRTPRFPQETQATSFSRPSRTSVSKRCPQASQMNS
jgi:hypothetical protein